MQIQSYPTLVLIEANQVYVWEHQSGASIVDFIAKQYKDAPKHSAFVGPFTLGGRWKYRVGTSVMFLQQFYTKHTEGTSQLYTLAFGTVCFLAAALSVIVVMLALIWLLSPKSIEIKQE